MRPRVRRSPDAAGRAALALYRNAPLAARVHVHVRWWSAPFAAVAPVLPDAGRVLEIGCGHGLFSAYAALTSPRRTVRGVDIDTDKIEIARSAARRCPADLEFAEGASGSIPAGEWDAVVFVDVLYLLPAAEQRALLDQAAAALAPGGVLVVKEMDLRPRWKARWNAWQETLSVSVLRITEGSSFDFVAPSVMAGWLEEAGLVTRSERLDRGRLHPHHLLTARRAG